MLEQVGEVEPESERDVSLAPVRSIIEISSASVSPSSAFKKADLESDSSLCTESPMLLSTPVKAEETASSARRSRSSSWIRN